MNAWDEFKATLPIASRENVETAEASGSPSFTKQAFEAGANSVAVPAIDLALQFGGIDGAHHKSWVIDQMVRLLAGEHYERIIRDAKAGEDGPDTYEWEEGIPP